jgi:hypothetical protein
MITSMLKVKVRFVITDYQRVLLISENGVAIKGELNWTGEMLPLGWSLLKTP